MLDILVVCASLVCEFLQAFVDIAHGEIAQADVKLLVGENIHVELHKPGDTFILDSFFFRFLML